jgi:cysteine synthase A
MARPPTIGSQIEHDPADARAADRAPEGSVILAMLPDTAERHLSTALFEGIAEGVDLEP